MLTLILMKMKKTAPILIKLFLEMMKGAEELLQAMALKCPFMPIQKILFCTTVEIFFITLLTGRSKSCNKHDLSRQYFRIYKKRFSL